MLSMKFLVFLIICNIACEFAEESDIVEQINRGRLGTVVKHNYVLTAGHCCIARGPKFIVTGDTDHEYFYNMASNNGSLNVTGYWTYNVAKEHIHPKYQAKKYTLLHDVCVLELEKNMDQTDGHTLAPVSYLAFYAQECTAVGWGQTENNELQFKLYYKKVFAETSWRGNWLLRLYFHTVCSGDSGGPLLCEGKVYGVASFSTTSKCSIPGMDYYAHLHSERDFLKKYVSRASITSYSKMYFILLILFYI